MSLIVKEYSTPKNAEVWAKFKSFSWVLLLLALTGNFISGYTEYTASDSWFQGVLMVVFLEGGAWIASGMLFGNLFNLFRTRGKDVASWFFVVIGAILLFNIIATSFNMSDIGKDKHIHENEGKPSTVSVDSTASKTMKDRSLQQYKADSLQIVANIEKDKRNDRTALKNSNKTLLLKKSRIMKYADYSYEKYKTSIVSIESQLRANNNDLRNLNSHYNSILNTKMAIAKSKYNEGLSVASSSLLSSVNQVDSLNTAAMTAYLLAIERKKSLFKYIIYLGICFTVLYEFMYHLFRFLAGAIPTYSDPLDGLMSPFDKIKYGASIFIWKKLDWIGNWFLPKNPIILGDKAIKFDRTDLSKVVQVGIKTSSPTLAASAPTEEPINETLYATNHGTHGTITNNLAIQNSVLQNDTPIDNIQQSTPIKIFNDVFTASNPSLKGEVERAQIGFKQQHQEADTIEFDTSDMERVGANEAELEDLNKGFDYNKYSQQLVKNFDRMVATKTGAKRKTHDWKEIAKTRAEKIATLTQLFVSQGYKVETIVDKNGCMLHFDKPEYKSLAHLPKDALKVEVYAAPNGYRLPIWINYPNLVK